MTLKEGVSIDRLTLEMREAATAVEECYRAFGAECVVASGDEATTAHHGLPVAGGTKDPHYEGLAVDFSVKDVPHDQRAALALRIADTLECHATFVSRTDGAKVYSGRDYVLRWEAIGTENEHLHLQRGHVNA